MSCVLHLAERAHWARAVAGGTYDRSTRGASVAGTGFIHASTASQLGRVADALYADVPVSELALLVVDEDALVAHGVDVVWENIEGGTEPFPHLYGALPTAAVTAVLDVDRDGDGHVVLPDLDGLGVRVDPPART